MKKLIIAAFILTTTLSYAQNRSSSDQKGRPSSEEMVNKMTQELNLTSDQQTKVKALFEKGNSDRKNFNSKDEKEFGQRNDRKEGFKGKRDSIQTIEEI